MTNALNLRIIFIYVLNFVFETQFQSHFIFLFERWVIAIFGDLLFLLRLPAAAAICYFYLVPDRPFDYMTLL